VVSKYDITVKILICVSVIFLHLHLSPVTLRMFSDILSCTFYMRHPVILHLPAPSTWQHTQDCPAKK